MLVELPTDDWSFAPRVTEARIDRGKPLARRLQFATIPGDRPFNLVTKTFCYGVRTGAKPVGGESGTALRFGGAASGDNFRFSDASHSIGSKYTGAQSIVQVPHTWVFRFKALAVSTRGGLMQYTDQDAGNSGLYAFLEGADSTARYSVSNSGSNYTSSPTYTLNKWHTVAFTYDPVSNKLNSYLDGKRGTEATEASPTTNTSISRFLIGDCFAGFDRELDGEISLFAFWDRALTPSEGRFLTNGDNWLTLFEGEQSVFFPAESAGAGGFTTTLETKAIGDQAQITGLISALDVLAKAGLVQSTGLVTVLDALASTGQAAVTGHVTTLDALTKLGLQASFPGVAGFATVLDALTAAGQAAGTGHGTVLDALTAAGLQQNLGAVGEFTTVLDSLSAAGQAAALGLITALDALTVTERAQALGFITSVNTLDADGLNQSFGGAGFTTALKALAAAGLSQGMTIWDLGDALAAAYADLPAFFDTFGFSEPVVVGAVTVRGLFDDDSVENGELAGPQVMLQVGDVDTLGIDQGTEITIRGRAFYVAGVQRDGLGLANVVLRDTS